MNGPRPVTPVGILAARLTALAERLPDPEVRALRDLAAGLEPYVDRCTTPASPALQAIARRTAAADWTGTGVEQEMLSGHTEGMLLALLVRVTGARRVLEIGAFTGYATRAMAEALPADGVVVACELDPAVAAFAREGLGDVADRVDLRVGPALDTLADLDEPFDLVFLDADKAGYAGYLDALLDRRLLARRGLLCVDNTLLQGEPWSDVRSPNGAAVTAFNEKLAADERVRQVLLPLRDGVTFVTWRSP